MTASEIIARIGSLYDGRPRVIGEREMYKAVHGIEMEPYKKPRIQPKHWSLVRRLRNAA